MWDEVQGTQPTRASWRSRTFSIAIDHFILPRLRDAQAFVADAESVLLNAARNSMSVLNSDGTPLRGAEPVWRLEPAYHVGPFGAALGGRFFFWSVPLSR